MQGMKQRGLFGLLLLSFILVSGLVSAAETGNAFKPLFDLAQGIYDGVIGLLSGPLALLLGETSASADLASSYLPKLLIAILLFSVFSLVLGKAPYFKDHTSFAWVGSAAIAILSVRFLTYEFILTAILPNTAVAIAVTAILPFIVFFFVTREFVPIARKLSWVFLAVVFFGMWLTFAEKLGDISWIYLVFVGLAALMVIFDRKLEALWQRFGVDDILETRKIDAKIALMKDFDAARISYSSGSGITKAQYKTKLDTIIRSAKAYDLSDVEALAKHAKSTV